MSTHEFERMLLASPPCFARPEGGFRDSSLWEDDFAWADGMVIAIPASLSRAATELKMYLHALATARSNGKLRMKAAAVIVSGCTACNNDHSAAALLSAVLSDLHLTTVPSEPGPCVDGIETARRHSLPV